MEDAELRERLDRIESRIAVLIATEADIASVENVPVNKQTETVVKDRITELLAFVDEKRDEAKDPMFEQYLNVMEGNLLRQQTQIDDLANNIEKNYQQYKKNMEMAEKNKAIMTLNVPVSDGLLTNNTLNVTPEMEEINKVHLDGNKLHSDISADNGLQTDIPDNKELHNEMPVYNEPESDNEPKINDVLHTDIPVAATDEFQSGSVDNSKPLYADRRNDSSSKKPDMEYKVGSIVLSVIGALFIISAFVIFGLNYMNNLAQGVLLYVLAGAVITFSEMIVRRSIEKFAQAVTGLGLCILYTATILNYLYLHTINAVVAIVLTLGVSAFALFLSHKRESSLLRLIGIFGCYISFAPLNGFENETEFIIPCVMVMIANIMYIALPIQKERSYVSVLHSFANVVFTVYVVVIASNSEISLIPGFLFVLAMMVSIYAIFWKFDMDDYFPVPYILGLAVLTIVEIFLMYDNDFYYAATAIFAAVMAICFCFYRKKNVRWVGLYCFSVFVLITYIRNPNEFLIATAAILAIYKILSFREELKYADIVVSAISASIYLMFINSETNMQYAILAVFVLSVICLKYYKTFHEIAIWAVLEGFAVFSFDSFIAIPLSIAFMLLCLVLFETVDRFRDKDFKIFAYIALAFNVLVLAWAFELEEPVSLALLLVLEIIVIFFIFSQKHGMKQENVYRARLIALALFLTYMIFIFKIEIPIVTSILLMLLAIASVGAGFVWKQKCIRIYGLILSLFVCVKILLIDFEGTASQDRIILFFVVGVIALAISYIYMRIERSLTQKEKL